MIVTFEVDIPDDVVERVKEGLGETWRKNIERQIKGSFHKMDRLFTRSQTGEQTHGKN